MSSKKTAHGIILNHLPYKDYDLIFTALTKELGLAKFIFSRGNSYKSRKGGVINPFIEGEIIYTEKNSGLHKCHEVSPIHHHLKLRENFMWLKTASEITQLLQKTQLDSKPSPLLYDLTVLYLEHIPRFPCLVNLSLSFLLKLILHEGIFPFSTECAFCSSPLETIWLYKGESFCQIHAKQACFIQQNEFQLLKEIASCRSFNKLRELPPLESLYNKVQLGVIH